MMKKAGWELWLGALLLPVWPVEGKALMDRIPRIRWRDRYLYCLPADNFGSSTQALPQLEGFIKGLQGILIGRQPGDIIVLVLWLGAWPERKWPYSLCWVYSLYTI